MEYKKTLNMTKSGFPMRAGLPKREPEMLKHWEELDLYHELLKKNEGKPRFALHDGPPFSNGALHMGHALNKSIKDFITRSYAMRGYYTPYIPGWDNHGMPIESAIIKQNKLNRKAMGVAEFRSACHEFADHYIDVQRQGFKRMGVVGDWDHPYKTMDPAFEAQEVRVFGKMYEKGYIYKGLKPVYWCPHDETALAEAEIEYQDDPCTTVYVKFPMYDDLGKLSHLDKSKLNFVIWTTTIWTLPGNLAIALHPQEEYAAGPVPTAVRCISWPRPLVEKVMKIGGVEHYEIVETHPGAFFENMLASHPFLPKTSRLVLADYVTMDSGTGCVHTAPGFGADDYQTCLRYGMDMVVPVDDQGRHTDYAGKYAGMKTEESNPVILAGYEGERRSLCQRGDRPQLSPLLALQEAHHLPGHSPVVLLRGRPSRTRPCAACEDVRWVPAWGKDRMTLHDPGAHRLVHQPPAPLGSAHSRVLLQGLRQAHLHRRRPSTPSPACSRRRAPTPGSRWTAEEILPEGFTCPHCGKSAGFDQGGATRWTAGSTPAPPTSPPWSATQGFWPADHVSGGPGPVPRLVPVLPADRRGRFGPVAHPSRSASPTAGPWTVEGTCHAQVPGQRRGPGGGLQQVRRRPAASVGRLRRLPCGCALLRRDLQAAVPELSEVPQHRPVLPGQPGRLRPRQRWWPRKICWSWTGGP